MSLTSQQYEELTQVLSAAFDHDSLEQMVQFKLGKELFALVPREKGLNTVAFELIQAAEREGWTEALIRGAYISRPKNAKLAAFVEAHWPAAKKPREATQDVEAVQRGLQALAGIVGQLADGVIREIVGRFRADFSMTRDKTEALGRYKALHDQLHQLNTKYLRSMTDAAALCRRSEPQYQLLESYALQLKADAGRVRQVATGLRTYRVEQDWIDSLEQVGGMVLKALEGGEDAPLERAVSTLRRVLVEESIRINALLCDAAGDLRLPQLVQAMQKIRDRLREVPGGGGPQAQRFEAGLTALLLLQPRLGGLVEEHFEWQWLDKEFTAADTLPGATPEDRFPRWPTFRVRLLRLCDLSAEKEWARELTALLGDLEQAGAARDAIQFGRRYNKFRTVAADRFFNLDAEMRDLSEQLAQVADPLNQLLRIVTDGPD
jgi:hypothetical protein